MELNESAVSIIMPAYNVEDYIEESIYSILNQSFSDFELLIVDDKSNDNTIGKIDEIKDSRIKLFKNEKNLGQSISKNYAIKQAKGNYIAFMDADDICHPEKLRTQVDFLRKNVRICGVGTMAKLIDAKNKIIGKVVLPLDFDAIKVQTLFYPCFVHPSILVRREAFYDIHKLFYNTDYLYAQDYELYTRMVHKVVMANIPDFSYFIRKWPLQISKIHNAEQIDFFISALKNQLLNVLQIELSEDQVKTVRITCRNKEKRSLDNYSIETYMGLLRQIWISNFKYNIYNNQSLKDYLIQRYMDAFSVFKGSYSKYLSCYFQLEKDLLGGQNLKNRLKMTKRYLVDLKRKI